MLYRPREIASKLGIAPSTLRLWSVQFARQLSDQARKASAENSGPWAQRRYTEEDLELLLQVKSLMAQGLTYDEVKRRLAKPSLPAATPRKEVNDGIGSVALTVDPSVSLSALQELLKAKDKTIATLKESLSFLDTYLQAVRQERDDARERVLQLEKELRELQAQLQRPASSGARSWLKQVISGM
jgi:DNA-binding transcriptional MerR regulator